MLGSSSLIPKSIAKNSSEIDFELKVIVNKGRSAQSAETKSNSTCILLVTIILAYWHIFNIIYLILRARPTV